MAEHHAWSCFERRGWKEEQLSRSLGTTFALASQWHLKLKPFAKSGSSYQWSLQLIVFLFWVLFCFPPEMTSHLNISHPSHMRPPKPFCLSSYLWPKPFTNQKKCLQVKRNYEFETHLNGLSSLFNFGPKIHSYLGQFSSKFCLKFTDSWFISSENISMLEKSSNIHRRKAMETNNH